MFDLVADIERYPEFVPLCLGSRIRSRTTDTTGADVLVVDMYVGQLGIRERFVTRDTLNRSEMTIHIDYLEGPFRAFENLWSFHEDGPESCRVEFFAEYEFRNRMLGLLMGSMFEMAYRSISAAFSARADIIYGRPSLGVRVNARSL
jgi:coenzyme Q-binding protein COQ10